LTNRYQYQRTFKRTDEGGFRPTDEGQALAGRSEVILPHLGIRGKQRTLVTDAPTKDGMVDSTISFSAANGFYGYPPAPDALITGRFEISVSEGGVINIEGGSHTGYPSFAAYAYEKDATGKVKTRPLYEFKETDIGTLSDPDSPRGLARMRVPATHLEPLPSAADATTTGPDQSLTAPAKESPPREVDDKQPNAQPQADGVEHQPEDGETN